MVLAACSTEPSPSEPVPEPKTELARPETEPAQPETEPAQPSSPGAPPTATLPPSKWQIEIYDPQLVWLDRSAFIELLFELCTGTVATHSKGGKLFIDAIGTGGILTNLGFQPGDVIVAIDGQVPTLSALHQAWAHAQHSKHLVITLRREEREFPVRLWLAEEPKPQPIEAAATMIELGVEIVDDTRRRIDRRLLAKFSGKSPLGKEDEFVQSLGLPERGRIVRIDGTLVEDGVEGLAEMAKRDTFILIFQDGEDELKFEFTVADSIMSEAALQRFETLAGPQRIEVTDPNAPHADRFPPGLEARIPTAITTITTDHIRIEREFLKEVLNEPSFSRQVRLVPNVRDGVVTGFKLYAIRPYGLLHVLGARNGDQVLKIGDRDFTSPENIVKVWNDLRNDPPNEVIVVLERRGVQLELRFEIE